MTEELGLGTRPSWRRHLHFRVRTLIVLVFVIGGWLGWIVHGARTQREAVAAIKRVGGKVIYDWQGKNGSGRSNAKPPAPDWLVDLIGVDYFGHVTAVYLFGGASDPPMVHIGNLGQVESLYIGQCSVTDEGLEKLEGLSDLQVLHLNGTLITDAGLEHLKRLSSLRRLDLSGTRIHDAGLTSLKDLRALEDLDLGITLITDAGLESLTGLTNLRGLDLSHTNVGDAGLSNLRSLTGLRFLSLDNTQVSDAGLVTLKSLRNLWLLKVAGSPGITGTGLRDLEATLTNAKIER